METSQAILSNLVIHFVGSKNNADPLVLSAKAIDLETTGQQILQESLLQRFRGNAEYHAFVHPESLLYNEAYQYCKKILSGEDFVAASASIARHLYEQSTHPKVKGGELYVALFEGLPVDGRVHKAVGLFKSEHKSTFLDVEQKPRQLLLHMKEGVEVNRIDKGCLVIANNEKEGYDVLLFDNQNRGEEAQYWKEKFLGLAPQQNEFHHTAHFLSLARQFITGPLESEMKVPRTEQVELLHKSLNYFKSNDSFDIEDFQKEVFQDEDMIDSFRRFGTQYVTNAEYDIASSFEISPEAVKKQSRIYKSVLKLDKNFHIYIHGRTDLIERGTEMDGRKYYKIYYQEEA